MKNNTGDNMKPSLKVKDIIKQGRRGIYLQDANRLYIIKPSGIFGAFKAGQCKEYFEVFEDDS